MRVPAQNDLFQEAERGRLRPLRICMIAGAESIHARRWVQGLASRGHEVYLISGDNREVEGAKLAFANSRRGSIGARLTQLFQRRSFIQRLQPDVVHMHSVPSSISNLMYWRVPRLIVSSWGRDVVWDGGRQPFLRQFWIRFLLSQARALTSTSQFLAEETRKFAPSGMPISIIPFGIDCDQFSLEKAGGRRHNDGTVSIGFVKHLAPKYGPEYLLQAFARIVPKHPQARLAMIGDGELRPKLIKMIDELSLVDKVNMPGAIGHDEVAKAMSVMDIFVMPSIYESESFGVAALEASAMELPVIASRVGGVPEVVEDGKTGLLVPPKDIDSLANALTYLIENAEVRKRMGERGRKSVLLRYTWERGVSAMEAVYRDVAERPD